MKTCPKCGRKWPDKAKFCPVDGGVLVSESEKPVETEEDDAAQKSADPGKKNFSPTKWFMVGDHIKDEDLTPEDLTDDDLEKVYKKTGKIPDELRKKYSLNYEEKKSADPDDDKEGT